MPAGEQNSNMLADAIGDQIVDYARIRKGRRVTKIGHIALRDLAKDAPHDLAGTCLGQGRCKLNGVGGSDRADFRSEEHTSELQSLMRISYAVFCLKKKRQMIKCRTQEFKIYENIQQIKQNTVA